MLKGCCNAGPITNHGFIVTKSIPFSSANFQAPSSAKVLASAYQSWINKIDLYYIWKTMVLYVNTLVLKKKDPLIILLDVYLLIAVSKLLVNIVNMF